MDPSILDRNGKQFFSSIHLFHFFIKSFRIRDWSISKKFYKSVH